MLTGDSGSLLLTPTRLTGRITGVVTTSAPGVHFDGAFTADVDSDAGSVTTTGQGVTLTVGDLTFTGIDLTLIGAHDADRPRPVDHRRLRRRRRRSAAPAGC